MYDFNSIYQACSIQDAVRALSANPAARIIAGGTDMLVKIRDGVLAGCDLISINNLTALRGITMDDDGSIHIGPLTTFRDLQHDPIVRAHIPVLAAAAGMVGSPQVRAVGTLGGNVSNGVTTADTPPSLFSLNAVMVATGPDGWRALPIQSYYLAPETINLKPNELLTDIVIRRADYEGYAGHYIKYSIRNAMDIALLGCSVILRLSGDKKVLEDIRLSFGAAGPLPLRATKTEDAIRGNELGPALLDKIGSLAPTQDVSPITDRRASRDFRLHLIGLLARDAFKAAVKKAGGVIDA